VRQVHSQVDNGNIQENGCQLLICKNALVKKIYESLDLVAAIQVAFSLTGDHNITLNS
jgi:hypothetical protein